LQGWQRIVERHNLKNRLRLKDQDTASWRVEVPLEQQDWRGYQLPEQQEQLKAYFNAARSRGFNLSKPPLMRLALSRWETSINSSGPIIISSWMAGAVPG